MSICGLKVYSIIGMGGATGWQAGGRGVDPNNLVGGHNAFAHRQYLALEFHILALN